MHDTSVNTDVSMDSRTWRQAQDLFHEAIALSPEERPAFLESACGLDDVLRHAVAGMLDADEDTPAILDATLDGLATLIESPPPSSILGQQIGPYVVLRELGRGGMGTVYLAERRDLQKQVALQYIVALYEQWGKQEQAAVYVAQLNRISVS